MMRLPDVRALLAGHLAGRPTRANFRTGTLTVCTMVPMRSVPHRVVCLVGLDDGVFPRIGVLDGDDVLARSPMTGERDIRSEDRQLLLDAICAATDKLVVTYTGANEYSGQPRPPAVPLAELLDALDRTIGEPSLHQSCRAHPLQPFDIRNVTPGALGAGEAVHLRPHRAAAPPPSPEGDTNAPDRPAARSAARRRDTCRAVEVLRQPGQRLLPALDFTLPWEVEGVDDAMPVEIDNLQEWTVGQRLLTDMLAGMDPDRAQAEWRRGALPPGRLGWRKANELRDERPNWRAPPCPINGPATGLRRRRRSGRRPPSTGTVHRCSATDSWRSPTPNSTPSTAEGVDPVGGAGREPGRGWSAVCVGGQRRRGRRERVRAPLQDPVSVLRDLVALYDAGRREPIPLPIKTSYAWAAARHKGTDPRRRRGRSGQLRGPRRGREPAHEQVWGQGTA